MLYTGNRALEASGLQQPGPIVMFGVPRLSAVLAFAAYAVVATVSRSFDKSSALRATFVSVAFVGFTATALYFNMQRSRSDELGYVAWRLISFAAVIAMLFELWLAADSAIPSFPSPAPSVWLTQSLTSNIAIAVGVLLMHEGSQTARHRVRMGLDSLAFFVASLLVLWVIGARDEIANATTPLSTRIEALSTYGMNALQLGIVIYVGSRATNRLRGPLGWFLMAPISRSALQSSWPEDESVSGDPRTYGPVMLALIIVLPATMRSGLSDLLLAAGVPLLVAILLTRQFLAVRDVRELSRTREDRVRERTEALRQSEMALRHVVGPQRARILEAAGARRRVRQRRRGAAASAMAASATRATLDCIRYRNADATDARATGHRATGTGVDQPDHQCPRRAARRRPHPDSRRIGVAFAME